MNRLTIDMQLYSSLLKEHAEAFAGLEQMLISENKKMNLTRITSPQQIRIRHVLDSLAGLAVLDNLFEKLQRPLCLLDAGSGAGFPGLVLGIVRPEWHIVSLEATEKKVRFQQHICDALNLQNVRVVHGRSEDIAHRQDFRERFDAVTARALAGMPILAELTLGLVAAEGIGLYWKGSHIDEEVKQARRAVKDMGGTLESIATYELPEGNSESVTFSLVVCRKLHSTPKKYPRVFGLIKKVPLGSSN